MLVQSRMANELGRINSRSCVGVCGVFVVRTASPLIAIETSKHLLSGHHCSFMLSYGVHRPCREPSRKEGLSANGRSAVLAIPFVYQLYASSNE